ncbi:MAG: type II toxin-antitoxin system prevent-host-death family antitoxin [Candidatus Dadabacteria bacterium]|nr:MAG: type II toxin-antitoxin system prevent-host-death family antitoxin [Candidatus Dadabacteria bacterium]
MAVRVGVREAKAHLSRYLRIVKAGGEVILTDRGRPVGKIVPIEDGGLFLEDRIARLETEGVLEPANPGARLPEPVLSSGRSAQEYLREDRER